MTAPVPEESDEQPISSTVEPPGEHAGELPDGDDDVSDPPEQQKNAETSAGQPSQ